MIAFRHADARYPFLWETDAQPGARWHEAGEGPVAYLAETPDGAWAEFLRHEGITDPEDLPGVRRALWAVELVEPPTVTPRLPARTTTGGMATWPACRAEARRLRARGHDAFAALSAALVARTPSGFRTEGGLRPGPARAERTFVLFGRRPALVGWCACAEGRPRADLLTRVRTLH
jgi:hypothetical protein